ncbi:IucA/IucC family protein [Mangrovactinospora gilvigrisea]|uniref:IucA/IucC family protein n=1 Tax=Mangrovactinospora gilvigrisea TaxID=1428644 RepID=A0A1J7BJ80_9ACTN|nr:IucA/IucC family siderophore biosynthesis protein [Mangrovactinospora gilvigrisea]OIV38694.1 IucA/IucC family protein [Mangrovactinospora gilvigrisea]
MTATALPPSDDPAAATAHLHPAAWDRANRQLVAKALAEFAHELLLVPRRLPDGRWQVHPADGGTDYRFSARRMALDHWAIDAASITRQRGTEHLPLDAADLILEFRAELGLSDRVLPLYLEEITSTLAAAAYKLDGAAATAEQLAEGQFQDIEAGMTQGHPCFVANSGRLGFDAGEYRAYAPEAGVPVRLLWLAADRDRAHYSATPGLDHDALLRAELDPATLDQFAAVLAERGRSLADVHLIPVHPWQWWNRLAVTFADEIATGRLVLLGEGEDEHRPQQSIRTFFNTSRPERHYTKTALSVLNMGFYRGLSADYMAATPAINDWVHDLADADPVLRAAGLTVLRERAAVGYRHARYEAASAKGSPYRKMLAALWRESPVPLLGEGERLATMAALLHTDRAGRSLAAALVRGSGLEPEAWLRAYLDAYLVPVLHCFYRYGLVFMPHGENVILALDGRGVPRRAFFKDIGEEVALLDPDAELPEIPEAVRRIVAEVPEEQRLLSVFTDVLDCFLRFLAAELVAEDLVTEDGFWAAVAGCAADYQDAHPGLAERFARYDLFAERFARSCLNRLQLRDNQQMVDLADPAGAVRAVGTLVNPLAPHRR